MTWQEWAANYLVEERTRKLTAIELLSSGQIGTSEMRDGVRVDTTDRAIATDKEHVAEIEQILKDAGVTFDA